MEKNKVLFSVVFMLVLMLNIYTVSALDSYPTKLVNEQFTFCQVCGDATYITLSSIETPNSTTQLDTNMTEIGSGQFCYNYTPDQLGRYDFRGVSDGCTGEFATYIEVNGSGQDVSSEQIGLIIIGIIVLVLVCIFFFILSYMFKHPGMKIFLMSLSAITLIVVIGIISSNASVYLAEFPNIVSMYNTYYKFVIYLAGACMLGIVGWLIYYSLKLFNKSRGINFDD